MIWHKKLLRSAVSSTIIPCWTFYWCNFIGGAQNLSAHFYRNQSLSLGKICTADSACLLYHHDIDTVLAVVVCILLFQIMYFIVVR